MQTSLFKKQGGVASVRALTASGVTEQQIRWAVRQGLLASIRHGWLKTADADPDIVAAVAAGGRLSCISAARHLGLWVPDLGGLHVSLPRHAGRHASAGLIAHWQGGTWRSHRPPVEPVDVAIRQLILCCDRETAICVIDSALKRKKVSMRRVEGIVATLPAEYASLTSQLNGLSESGYESLCRFRLSRLEVPIRVQPVIEGIGRVDLLLGDRLIIEADGREWHEGPDAYLVDRSRDLAAMRQSYLPLRLAPHHIENEWPWVELVVRSILDRREHLWSPQQRQQRASNGFGG